MTFEKWFEIFTNEVRKKGYSGPIDKDAFQQLFEDRDGELSPEVEADDFVKEMMD